MKTKKNKTIDDYVKLPHRMELIPDPDEGGYTVVFPELKGCLTCAETPEQAIVNAEDAKRAWITATLEDGRPIPEPDDRLDYSGEFRIRMPKTLHKELVEQARRENISMNQYIIFLLSRCVALDGASRRKVI